MKAALKSLHTLGEDTAQFADTKHPQLMIGTMIILSITGLIFCRSCVRYLIKKSILETVSKTTKAFYEAAGINYSSNILFTLK